MTLRQERDDLQREIARVTGLAGRMRRASDAERARISVTRALRLALARIAEASPRLGGELAQCVRTGMYCSYTPARTDVAEAPPISAR